MRSLIATLMLAGCGVVIKAFTVPYAEFCDGAQSCPFDNRLPSLLSDGTFSVSWLIVWPAAAMGVAVASAVTLFAVHKPEVRMSATVGLNVAGVVTIAFFGWLNSAYIPGRWGSVLGELGGLLILLAGVTAAAFTFSSRKRDRAMTAR